MILSRTMRLDDYGQMLDESKLMQEVNQAIGMWYPPQHEHRRWEYALALKSLWTVFGKEKKLRVSDVGCAGSFLSPMFCWLGHSVTMYELWTMGDVSNYTMEQMRQVRLKNKEAGVYEFRNKGMGSFTEEDRGVDAAFCISTLEHIGEYQKAFRDLLSSVKEGGLVFLTTDFAEDEEDHYQYAGLRAGKMFNGDTYLELLQIAECLQFRLLDTDQEFLSAGEADWRWTEENRLVNDYGFASLAMIRMPEKEKNERTMVAR